MLVYIPSIWSCRLPVILLICLLPIITIAMNITSDMPPVIVWLKDVSNGARLAAMYIGYYYDYFSFRWPYWLSTLSSESSLVSCSVSCL